MAIDSDTTLLIIQEIERTLTAIGVILTMWSSIINRRKIEKVERKVDTVAVKADEVKTAAIAQIDVAHKQTIDKLEEVKEAVRNGNGKK